MMPNGLAQFGSMLHGMGFWIEVTLFLVFGLFVWLIYHQGYKYFSTQLSTLDKSWPLALLKAIHTPLAVLLWFIFLCYLLHTSLLHMHAPSFIRLSLVYQAAIVIALFAMAMGFISLMQKELIRKISISQTGKANQTTIIATAQLARIILIVLTVLMLLQVTGIPISALLAVGSIGTLTVGMASKDTLENYMGGAMVFFDRPFEVGDFIQVPDQKIEGYVENIGWRLTKILGFDKRPYYIPNKIFSNSIIENASRMTHRQINKVIALRYMDIDKINPIVSAIDTMLADHPDLDPQKNTFVGLTDFGDSSLNILVNAYSTVIPRAPFQKVQQDVLLKIAAIIENHGAQCAFPTRTLEIPDALQIVSQPPH
jgi:MscS family membrane protein